ncbi:hypothetical protein D3P08_01980 [Paenibacillus nanensis]|uniref:DUF4872 domain-containing protein n=1 Tax=Paenibacillus nanensis TaxID=393251 RepID=A0A3A1VHE7_9BACL|nr:hypothetical protein [Paenibacillus nanensis]RIX60358.1 hypothetical protein D3P08_01980 [Paenibacillus nanensis]
MTHVSLKGLTMVRESKSYIDSLHAILTAAHLYDGPKYRLSGLTGMSYKFSVHERLLPLSVTAYGQWGSEHRPAAHNIGLFSIIDAGRTRHPTFRHYQQEAVKRTKLSLDQGVGVMYWLPEFGVIDGYDDEDRVFFVQDGWSSEKQIVLYDNFGLNFTEFWYYETFGRKVDIPYEAMLLESIRLAITDWDTPYKTLPHKDIGSGKLAYDFFVRALEHGDFDERGAVYILNSFIQSRKEIRAYLQEARGIWTEWDHAADLFRQLADLFPGMESCMIAAEGDKRIDRQKTGELIGLLRAAQAIEDAAVDRFRAVSAAYPDRKRSIVPRWGVHTPK